MSNTVVNGTIRDIAGKQCVFYDGYWIKYYSPPKDTQVAKKKLIEALTRRLFNHVEHGINIPGSRLNDARNAYQAERDPDIKRVKGAMLAGALFNRATDIFTKLVELEQLGVGISEDDSLMRECGQCLMEALDYGQLVKHRNGDESIDELWGEPFKAFSIPVEDFYQSRYVKIAQAMRDIDTIARSMVRAFSGLELFQGVDRLIFDFAEAGKVKCETLRSDPVIFDVWSSFVVAGEKLGHYTDYLAERPERLSTHESSRGVRLLHEGKDLLIHIVRARVPMVLSTEKFLERCEAFHRASFAGKHTA